MKKLAGMTKMFSVLFSVIQDYAFVKTHQMITFFHYILCKSQKRTIKKLQMFACKSHEYIHDAVWL